MFLQTEAPTRERGTLSGNDHTALIGLLGSAFDLYSSRLSPDKRSMIIDDILALASEDLLAYHQRDPSVRYKPVACLLSMHSTFFAVCAYRIARRLLRGDGITTDQAAIKAMRLSFAARAMTGVDIHPEASIGARFVIDHGWNTVIGQTARIGNDCYLLNDVTIGGRFAADAPDGKRHPTLGDRVQVCAGTRLLGAIRIGDDVFIGPGVTITTDIPAKSAVLRQADAGALAPRHLSTREQ